MGELEDDDETDMVELPGGAYDVEGIAPLEEIEEALKIVLPSDGMRTVAGYMMSKLGRMPRIGDRISQSGYTFQVLAIHGPKSRSSEDSSAENLSPGE